MDYAWMYIRFCLSRENRGRPQDFDGPSYHHILPDYKNADLGWIEYNYYTEITTDDICCVTHREHIFAHRLLARALKGNPSAERTERLLLNGRNNSRQAAAKYWAERPDDMRKRIERYGRA